MKERGIATITAALTVLVGCGGSARDESIETFGGAQDTGDAEGDDGDGAGETDGSGGSGGSADDAPADDGDSTGGSDDGPPTFTCDVTIACHDGAPIAGAGSNSVVPIGCGDGPFTLAQSIDVAGFADPEAPRSLPLLGDLDDDGDLDLVLNFRKAGAGYAFPGTGTGTVELSPASLSGGLFAGGWGGDLGDFTSDGRLDILFGDHVRGGRAWAGGGGMTFVEARAGLPEDVLFSGAGLADLNGDGLLDALFGADQFSSGLFLYSGDGAGTWTPSTAPAVSASNLGHFVFADNDDDGDLDVFAFGKSGPGVTAFVLRNDGGSFASIGQVGGGTSPLGADPLQGAVGDVDCDGDLDIATGGSVHLQEGGAWSPGAVVDGAQISQLADMNGDGHLDLVTHDPSVGLALYLGDGTGTTFSADAGASLPAASDTSHGAPIDTAYGIAIGDLNGNDALDIVRVAGFGPSFFVELWVR